jgi:peptide deformylase
MTPTLMPLYLRVLPDSALRLEAHEVADFDASVTDLAATLTTAMSALGGVGLAAPQLGVSRRVIVIRNGEEVQVLVNPQIAKRSRKTYVDEEGCLSMPGLLVPVERAVSVKVEAWTPQGAATRLELEGHGARILQHEVDHLDGVLTLDRLRVEDRPLVLSRLRELLPAWQRQRALPLNQI